MPEETMLSRRSHRFEAYENLIASLDTESDTHPMAFDNRTCLDIDCT
jgi:hypothetical protein